MEKIKFNVCRLGDSGPALLMLHGWGQNLHSLKPLGELLSAYFTVYIVDLPGFGKTPVPEGAWDTIRYMEWVLDFIDETGLDKVIVLGHSFGGRIAIRLAANHPDRIEAIVLMAAAGLQIKRSFSKKMRMKWIKAVKHVTRFQAKITGIDLNEWFINKYGSRDYKNAGRMRGTLVKTISENLTEEAKKITAPTFLLWGEKDQETPAYFGKEFNDLIKNSKLTILPGRDHFPFIANGQNSPDLCAKYILDFLRKQQEKRQKRKTDD